MYCLLTFDKNATGEEKKVQGNVVFPAFMQRQNNLLNVRSQLDAFKGPI